MSSPLLQITLEDLKSLKLLKTAEELENLLDEAAKEDLTYLDFLSRLTQKEMELKRMRGILMRTTIAKFPYVKTLESFDYAFQSSLDPKKIKELSECRFINGNENVILLGPPGVGKTHLSIGLGVKAIHQGHPVRFASAQHILGDLLKAFNENRLDERLKTYQMPRLLIVDEVGYTPIDRQGANLFFQLVSRRYERGSMILTSNQNFSKWGEVFGDSVIATAILDRLLHHSTVLSIKGESYRLKEKKKTGLWQDNKHDKS